MITSRLQSITESERNYALQACEAIAAQDRSNLFLVSQYLRDRRRYEAFVAMYAAMRVIDDVIDGIPDVQTLTCAEREGRLNELDEWRRRIQAAYVENPASNHIDIALSGALAAFPIPIEIWSKFLDAMARDLTQDRFATSEDFLNYAEGATAAPTIVYLFLLAAQPEQSSQERGLRFSVRETSDGFDYRACGKALGIFAYIAHILRDVVADLQMGKRGRIYIPISDMIEVGLSENEFCSIVRSGISDERWQSLVRLLCRRARGFEQLGVEMARARFPAMDPDCRFILNLIIRIYQDLLGKIEANPQVILSKEVIQKGADRVALAREAAAEAELLGEGDASAKL